MKIIEIGKYEIYIKKDNIICSCIFGSLYPLAYKEGNKVCRHIKQYLKENNDS